MSETSRNYSLRVTQNTTSCPEIAPYTLTSIFFFSFSWVVNSKKKSQRRKLWAHLRCGGGLAPRWLGTRCSQKQRTSFVVALRSREGSQGGSQGCSSLAAAAPRPTPGAKRRPGGRPRPGEAGLPRCHGAGLRPPHASPLSHPTQPGPLRTLLPLRVKRGWCREATVIVCRRQWPWRADRVVLSV